MVEVIVVGGGHAGCEAASAAARMGARVLLITSSLDTIGQMSCNPAIGGVAKGTVVREIDAFGGIMARAADRSTIQFRMLNRSKGPAVWAPRAQCDRTIYRRAVRRLLEENDNIMLLQGTVAALKLRGDKAIGVTTVDGRELAADAVILTAGTFLRGKIHIGTETRIPGGRAGDPAAVDIAEQLEALGLEVDRFKTGTPPRVDGRTVDFSKLERQDGEMPEYRFSHFEKVPRPEQRPCWITWAGEEVKEIIRQNLKASALYGGAISGRGPRYCPSVEDKVVKFPDAERHQIFLEPEGLDTCELYVNGLSTSLPVEVQLRFLAAVPGLERARMTRPGYAIEYDYYPPHQLTPWLEVKAIERLFFAGQINGTTGYEEAAAQGVLAGINAVRRARGEEPVMLGRDTAYIGVLVDDLVTRGVDEPYRLFTSRAEFRLLLRQDNALKRLGPLARELGMLRSHEVEILQRRLEEEERLLESSRTTRVSPDQANGWLELWGEQPLQEPTRIAELVRRPRVRLRELLRASGVELALGDLEEALMSVEIELKYEGYLERERQAARKLSEMANFRLPVDLPYLEFKSLSTEARQKLDRIRPQSLAQAGRIPGVSPSDLQNLVLEVLKRRRQVA
ncbi:MAG: tRNA uridine 5-carboxymethylaminomethyl modification enzyme MnmG [Gemmatimonadales bacterium]|nr:MAG: tRNA uridine 5-carboxymethylaminomethyl modification enzyme MnmG [Gemmatimonadales bacterium]